MHAIAALFLHTVTMQVASVSYTLMAVNCRRAAVMDLQTQLYTYHANAAATAAYIPE